MKKILGSLFFVLLLLCFFYSTNNSFAGLDNPFARIWSFVRDVNRGNIAGDASQGFSHDSSNISTARNVHSAAEANEEIGASGSSGGNIAGGYTDTSGSHGVLYDSGANALTTLDAPPSPSGPLSGTAPLASGSSGGNIAGGYTDTSDSHQSRHDRVTNTSITPDAPPSPSGPLSGTAPLAFGSSGGNIPGGYTDTSGSHTLLATPFVESVPEPSTFYLFGAGLVGVGLFRRRFKK